MKNSKKIALFALFFYSQLIFAQYFTLTPTGFISAEKNDYVVIDVPGVKKDVLYKQLLKAVNTLYSTDQKNINVVDGESISFTTYVENAITIKQKTTVIEIGKSTRRYDLNFSFSILFKDGKIRFDRPVFEGRRWLEVSGPGSGWIYLHLVREKSTQFAVYDKKGKILSQEAYDALNTFFNNEIKMILDKSTQLNEW